MILFKSLQTSRILISLARRGLLQWLSDEKYLEIVYYLRFHERINWEKPQRFNEKLQWLKLNNRKAMLTKLADKSEVKDYIKKEIGEEYIIPTISVFNKFEEIDFSTLPNQFVIKCTHDSGGLAIVSDKNTLDIPKIKKKINTSLRRNYYWAGREWPYKDIKPRILVEEYVNDNTINELRDYKFFCFSGKVAFFKIDYDRFTKHKANYYSPEGVLLEMGEAKIPPDKNRVIKLPNRLDEMLAISEKLSRGFPFLRVDLYEANDSIYFGELTFYPDSGFGKFVPDSADFDIGRLLKLKDT